MTTVRDIAQAIESFAPLSLQESYDNAGLQIGSPDMAVTAVLLCLDVTEDVIREARERKCNMIVSHHPLLFKGLRQISGLTPTQRIVVEAINSNIAIYSAHTNLDAAWDGVSHEIAHMLGVRNLSPLVPNSENSKEGLGVIGTIETTPTLEFLRCIKDTFNIKKLRYSTRSPQLVIRKVAICGGSGGSLIPDAVKAHADIIITGDIKYHDFTDFGNDIVIADIGHYEGELCTKKIFSRIIREKFPNFVTYFAESDKNPIKYI